MNGDILQAHGPSKLAEQKAADPSRESAPMLETVMQIVAEGHHGSVRDVVAEFGSPAQPDRVKDEPVRRLLKGDRASEVTFVLRLRSGWIERDLKQSRVKRRSHDVAMKRGDDAELEFDNEAVEAPVDRRMWERIDRPSRSRSLLGEAELDHGVAS